MGSGRESSARLEKHDIAHDNVVHLDQLLAAIADGNVLHIVTRTVSCFCRILWTFRQVVPKSRKRPKRGMLRCKSRTKPALGEDQVESQEEGVSFGVEWRSGVAAQASTIRELGRTGK